MRTHYWVGLATLFAASSALAVDVGDFDLTVQLDARAVAIDSPYTSFVHGGLGLLRYDEDHDGLRLGRLMADINGPITETLRGTLTLSSVGDENKYPIDITEAFLEWRPYPQNRFRYRTRVGAFYAPISLEHRSIGWQSPYSISSSAINTWIGEEVRTIGIEQSVSLQDSNQARRYALSLVGGLYIANDPMGILLFQRGWAMHDRQTGLWSELPRPNSNNPDVQPIQFYREVDGRIGYYIGAEYRLGQDHVVRALHYDNNGEPAARSGKEPAWLSRFDSIGWRYEMPTNTTLIVQGLKGDTAVGASSDGRGALIGEYWSYFALLSQQFGAHRVTARYDRLYTESVRGQDIFNSEQTALAWTFAYMCDFSNQWQFAFEALEMRGSLEQRIRRGLNPHGNERSIQLAVRYSL